MRRIRLLPARRGRHAGAWIVLGLTLAGSALSCTDEGTGGPSTPTEGGASLQPAGQTILVTNAAELVAALAPENTGKRILVRAGAYAITAPLTVPDRVTLEGEGVMQFGLDGLPVGFAAGPRTTLSMSTSAPGNLLTLGDGVTIRRLEIADLTGRAGNVLAVLSRDADDRVSATITESEIVSPNPHTIGPEGPRGCGLVTLTLNPNLGADPAPHEGATISARMVGSVIHTGAPGGCGLFAFNFAARGSVSASLADNVIGGGIIANGGVSRPDAVHDAKVAIESHGNLYRSDVSDACVSDPGARGTSGWNLTGGSGPPVPLPVPETARNALRVHSVRDRIEGFTTGIGATASRRFFGLPIAGPSTGNSIDLTLHGTRISTPSCGGAGFVRDLDLAGAFAGDDALFPGDGNSFRALLRGVTGSGPRFNLYANAVGPSGPLPLELQAANRLEIVGSPAAFDGTNSNVDPAPGAQSFTGGAP